MRQKCVRICLLIRRERNYDMDIETVNVLALIVGGISGLIIVIAIIIAASGPHAD